MKRRAKKEAAEPALPFLAAAVPPPRDVVGMAMCAEKAPEPPRNRVADLARAEAFYLSLADLPFNVDWDALHVFKKSVAAAITEMRLRP